ncbi:MAG: 2-C-methyl-D-erythritol 2,4-cyclodiphosphate synthase [Burkholderiaceae bacterium]
MSEPACPPIRIGQGYDIHALVPGRRLVLGGVTIEHTLGLLGHSDADALLHAITDAVLGAGALGDIGSWFPDSDPAHAGADSAILLARACDGLREAGYGLQNVDATVIAQTPRLRDHIEQMRENIARACGIEVGQVNVKGKTAERLGALGRQEGIAAQAVVLATRIAPPAQDR